MDRNAQHSQFTPGTIHIPNPVPCPFCGSVRIIKGERYFGMCVDCGATGPERQKDGLSKAFADWNHRAQINP